MTGVFTSALASLQSILSWTPFSTDRVAHLCTIHVSPSEMLSALPNSPRDFRINPLCKLVSEQTDSWSEENIGLLPSRVTKLGTEGVADSESAEQTINANRLGMRHGISQGNTLDLKAGLLASMCFAGADLGQLRLCADFLAWVWLLDYNLNKAGIKDARSIIEENIRLTENEPGSSELSELGLAKALQNILGRIERSPESSYVYERFRMSINEYLKLRLKQISEDSNSGPSQSTKNYITRQREQGWPMSLFILIEYAYGLETLSEEVQRRTTLAKMRDAAAEVIIYALDIYSCAGLLQQSNLHDLPRHNIVTLIAQEQGLHILPALGQAKEQCSVRLQLFSALQEGLLRESSNSRTILSNVTTNVSIYANALGDCIRGIVHWACESERFFGKDGLYSTLVVEPSGGVTDVHEDFAEE